MVYTEPSWLTEPPEDNRKTLGECDNCGQELLEGDSVCFTEYDEDRLFCCSDCFIDKVKLEKVLSVAD